MPATVGVLANCTVGVSATLSVTKDNNVTTGYPQLTMALIGEIVDLPEFGRTYNIVSHQPIAQRGTTKLKGGFNDGQVTLSMARDDDDAGQVIMLAALADDNAHAFEVTYADGSIDWFDAKTIGYNTIGGTQESIVMRSLQLELVTAVVHEVAP